MKHKHLKHLFTALLLLCATVATAYDFAADGIYYSITDATNKTVEVTFKGTSYNEYSHEYTGSVVIPESVTSYNGITYSVTSIGYGAFCGCSSLTSVVIGNSVTSIGNSAFSGCSSLTSVEIPSSVTSIGKYAFSGCSGLTSVVIGNSVTSIGNSAFYCCTGLTSVEIPNSVTSIGNYAFAYCSGLTSIEIPNSVTSIGDMAFSDCTGLTSVEIPNSVTSIGNSPFAYCSGLTSINVAAGNARYDSRDNCNAIIETETNKLTVGFKNTVIPNSVTSIGDWAFAYCFGLTSIEIPNSVTSIGDWAFAYCSGLTSIEIPNSVTSIGRSAFYSCQGLTSIVIPNSVTSIGDFAFYYCSGLTSVVIGNSVTSIGEYAFYCCTGLTSVEIPSSVTSIGKYAFSGCTGLESITINSKTPPAIQSSTFSGVTATLYVPYGAKATYQAANYWKNIANIVEMEAPEYNLAVTAAGYATLYLGFDAEIPEGVEVYYAKSVEGDLLKMQQVTGILPANTGAIVKADAGTYSFIYSDENPAAIEGNLLKGTEKATTVEAKSNAQYYVLSKVDGVVGMYLAQLTDGGFLNNANEAYLELTLGDLGIYDDEVDSSANGVRLGAGYRFDFGGTTGVSELKTENGNVKIMYDLQGRKVEKPTEGIYIINGKKMLVR